jgi:rfaE bifunctional protein kinase chain/domain
LEKEGIDTRFLIRSSVEITSVKTRLIAANQHLMRIDEENDAPVDEVIENELIHLITDLVDHEQMDAILVEDYDKGIMTKKLIRHLQILAAERPLKLAVDPKFRHFWDYKSFDLFKPNLREVNHALHQHVEANLADLEKAGRSIQQMTDCRKLMITLGDEGIFALEGEKTHHQSATHLDIVDVCGAGDAVISTATLCLIAGLSMDDILYWSNKAGAEVCRYPGVVAVRRKDLEE